MRMLKPRESLSWGRPFSIDLMILAPALIPPLVWRWKRMMGSWLDSKYCFSLAGVNC